MLARRACQSCSEEQLCVSRKLSSDGNQVLMSFIRYLPAPMQPEALQQVLGRGEQVGVPAIGFLVVGRADDELLDLLELVHPEQPADVTPGAACLTAEAGRDARVANR